MHRIANNKQSVLEIFAGWFGFGGIDTDNIIKNNSWITSNMPKVKSKIYRSISRSVHVCINITYWHCEQTQ